MELRDLAEQFICERIQDLMNSRPEGDMIGQQQCADDADQIMESLTPDLKQKMEDLLSQFVDRSADDERFLYLSGVQDGIRISTLPREWHLILIDDNERKKGK